MEGSGLAFAAGSPGPPGPEGPQVAPLLPLPSPPSWPPRGIPCHRVPCHHPTLMAPFLLLAGGARTARGEGEEPFLALCWSQPQEPGSVLPGCPWAACGDAPALTPLSLQGEVGSPGQPGLPGLKVGAPGHWDGLCASTWVCRVLGRTPVLPSLGLSGGCSTLHLALSRTLLQGDAGVPGVDGRPGLEGFPGPQVGASAPPLSRSPLTPGRAPLVAAGPLAAASSPAAKIHPSQCLQLFPCSGTGLTACQRCPRCLGARPHQLAILLATTSAQKHPNLARCLDLAGRGGWPERATGRRGGLRL